MENVSKKTLKKVIKTLDDVKKKGLEQIKKFEQELSTIDLGNSSTIRLAKVDTKSPVNYVAQVNHNLSIGRQSMYIVARDVADAYKNLNSNSNYLKFFIEHVQIDSSTLRKFKKIGESKRLALLYHKAIMPSAWTTQYTLAIMEEKLYSKVLNANVLSASAGMREISNAISGKKTTDSKTTVLEVSVESDRQIVPFLIEQIQSKLNDICDEVANANINYNVLSDVQFTNLEKPKFSVSLKSKVESIKKNLQKQVNDFLTDKTFATDEKGANYVPEETFLNVKKFATALKSGVQGALKQ